MTSKRFREIRLVAPVIACWCILFYVLFSLDVGLDKRGPSRWDSLLIATSGIGMWMAVVWLSLYRRTRWIPIFLLFLLVAIVLSAIHYYAHPRGRELDLFIGVGVCPFIASMVGLVSLVLVRRLSGWQIIDDTDSMEMAQPQFSRKGMFFLAAILAAVCGAVAWAGNPEKVSAMILVIIVIPITCGMFLLFTMSKFRVQFVWPVALVLAALAAAATMLISGRPVSRSGTLFATTFGAYLYAACLLLLAASYLRLRGVLFQFGGASGFAARRDASLRAPSFAKLFVRTALGFLLVFLILSACLSVWRFRASRQAKAGLAAIANSGLPTTREEARHYYKSLQTGADLYEDWNAVFESIEESTLEADFEEYEKRGQKVSKSMGAYMDASPPSDTPDLEEDVERLAALTAKHSTLIDQVCSTARKNGYIDLFNYEKANFLPEMQKLRRAVGLLRYDAIVALDRGDSERFLVSVESIFQIAQLMDNTPLLVGQIAQVAVIGMGTNVVHQALSRLQLSREASERIASKLSELDLTNNFRQGLIGERAMMAECFHDLQLWPYADRITAWSKFRIEMGAPSDLCFYLDQLQNMIDAFEKTPQEAFQIADSTNQIADIERPPPISGSLVPAFRPYMVPLMRTTFHADACRTGLAIEGYREQYNHLPESLDDLVPEYLDNVPIDHLDGKPLRFEATAEGYRIYSVGHNGRDGEGPGSLYHLGPKLVLEVPRSRIDTQ